MTNPLQDLVYAHRNAEDAIQNLQDAMKLATAAESRAIMDLIGEFRAANDKLDCLLNDAKTDRRIH